MWKRAPRQSAIQSTLAIVVIACLSVLIASPGATASPALKAAARTSRPRNAAAALKTGHSTVKQAPAGVNSDQQILIRLENAQRTLEQQAAVLNAAVQRQISQLRGAIEDSRKETQQLLRLNAKTNWTRVLLMMVLALLVVIASGLVYVAWQLSSLTGRGLMWKAERPVLALKGKFADFPDDRNPGSADDGIASLRIRPRNP